MGYFAHWFRYKSKVRRLAQQWLAGDHGARQKLEEERDFRQEYIREYISHGHLDQESVRRAAGTGKIRWFLRQYRKRRAVFELHAIEDRYWRDVEERVRRENAMWNYVDLEVRRDVIRRAKAEWDAARRATQKQVAAKHGMTVTELLTEAVILGSDLQMFPSSPMNIYEGYRRSL
jgi:DNA-dependent RNA polymerase auxiliary subunit epsilon